MAVTISCYMCHGTCLAQSGLASRARPADNDSALMSPSSGIPSHLVKLTPMTSLHQLICIAVLLRVNSPRIGMNKPTLRVNGTISSQHLILRQPLFSDSGDANNRAGSRRQVQRSNHSLGIGTLHTRSGSSMDSTAIIHPSAHLNLPG